MAEHTPTPWFFDSEGILPIDRDDVAVVARVPNHPNNAKNWDANAAFIVKAVAEAVLNEYALQKGGQIAALAPIRKALSEAGAGYLAPVSGSTEGGK